jgi:radical SAM superfamily enzyme YgiQ (UPF0313 family)
MRVKLIYSAGYGGSGAEVFRMPYIAIPILTSYLRSNGIEVDQDDIEMKVYHHNIFSPPNKRIDLTVFEDRERIENFLLRKKKDPQLRSLGERILAKLDLHNFDLIGFSIIDFSYLKISSTLVISKLIKEKINVPIVIGGADDDVLADIIEKYDFVDYCIKHQGEAAILKLCHMIEKKGISEKNVGSLIYRKNGKVYINPEKDVISDIICPDFEGLPLELYTHKSSDIVYKYTGIHRSLDGPSRVLVLPYSFTRGCPYHCTFCSNSASPFVILKPVKEVVVDLKKLSEKHKTKFFYFLNTNVNPTYDYISDLCDEIARNGLEIYWFDCANIRNVDKDMLKKMRESGAIHLMFGLETGSQRLLDYVEKGITIEKMEKILKTADKLGIWNGIELIAGLPYETDDDIQKTIGFIRKNHKYIDTYHLNKFFIAPGSLFMSHPEKYGLENIRTVNTTDSNMICRENVMISPFIFDEINGLKWKEKQKQILESKKKIENAIKSLNPITPIHTDASGVENTHLLFYLYSVFTNKTRVRDWIQKHCDFSRVLN